MSYSSHPLWYKLSGNGGLSGLLFAPLSQKALLGQVPVRYIEGTENALQLMHADICGSITPSSITDNKYFFLTC